MNSWTLAQRAIKMNPSALQEIIKTTSQPGIINFAGGLPAPETFPVEEISAACAWVFKDAPSEDLQYCATEGYFPLREAIANNLPWSVDPSSVLIINGGQQALDLVAKVLIDPAQRILVESPTYLGALHAFSTAAPSIDGVANDADGLSISDLESQLLRNKKKARFLYMLPNFQNPTGCSITEGRRQELSEYACSVNLPIIEDDPYGDLWFTQRPPLSLTARNPAICAYIGSFSKILSPGLRLGYIIAPPALYTKLLQAKQACDMHTPGLIQRMVYKLMKDGFIERHIPSVRSAYKIRCETMLAALSVEMKGLGVRWNSPGGGLFIWAKLPKSMDATEFVPEAIKRGVAYLPGAHFYAQEPDNSSFRLCFANSSQQTIQTGIAALAQGIRERLQPIVSI